MLKTIRRYQRIIKFLTVGGSAGLVGLLTLWSTVDFLNIHYLIGDMIAFITSVSAGYLGNWLWTFREKTKRLAHRKTSLLSYIILYIINLGMIQSVSFLMIEYLKVQYILATLFASLILVPINYWINKSYIFKRATASQEDKSNTLSLIIRQVFSLVWNTADKLRIIKLIANVLRTSPWLSRRYESLLRLVKGNDMAMVNDSKMILFLENSQCAGASMLVRGKYEPCTTELFKKLLKPGMIAVDIGAHIGYYTLLSSRLVGKTGQVYAFEPEPQNYKLLLKNISLNNYSNIVALQIAIYNKDCFLPLYIGSMSGTHSLIRVRDTTEKTINVKALRLDSFIPPGAQVNLVKMDTQGTEQLILEGMERIIKDNRELVIITEFEPDLEHKELSLEEYIDNLIQAGFNHIYIIDERNNRTIKANYQSAVDFCSREKVESVNLLCQQHLTSPVAINLCTKSTDSQCIEQECPIYARCSQEIRK